jgi:hypothetical protein
MDADKPAGCSGMCFYSYRILMNWVDMLLKLPTTNFKKICSAVFDMFHAYDKCGQWYKQVIHWDVRALKVAT